MKDTEILNDETMKELTGQTDEEYNQAILLKDKFVLDACCGPRQMWFNKAHLNVLYIDIRREEKGFSKHRRKMDIQPDIVMDFRELKFPDNSFKLVVWDPPHLATLGKTSEYAKKFGILNKETWPYDLKKGFKECWRVLEDYGILIFKWSNYEFDFNKVLRLFPVSPLFGNTTTNTKKSQTKWFCFMKIPK